MADQHLKRFLAGIFALAVFGGHTARADQCMALKSQEQATQAVAHLPAGSEWVSFCEPCGDAPPVLRNVGSSSSSFTSGSKAKYWTVSVDGNEIDLAYVFVRDGNAAGGFTNLASLVGCSTTSVSAFLPTSAVPGAKDPPGRKAVKKKSVTKGAVDDSRDDKASPGKSEKKPSAPRPADPPPATGGGCTKDTDCKGDRICEGGVCVNPPAH